jgi:hypothetical protein
MSKTFRVVTREEGGSETEEYITADGVSPDKGDNMVRLYAYGTDGEKEVVAVYHAWQVKSAVDTDHLVDKPAPVVINNYNLVASGGDAQKIEHGLRAVKAMEG